MFGGIGALGDLAKIILAILDYLGLRADGLRSYLRQVADAQKPQAPITDDAALQKAELEKLKGKADLHE